MSCAQFGSHHCVVFFSFFSKLLHSCCRALLWSCFGGSCSVLPFTPVCHTDFSVFRGCGARSLGSQSWGIISLDWTHLCNKLWGTVPWWWHIIDLSWTKFSKGTAFGWVLHCPFWISDVTRVSYYPVLVIWMRDDSKLLKTDIFCSQLLMSAAGTNVPEFCDWLLLCPAALGVFCLNVVGGETVCY